MLSVEGAHVFNAWLHPRKDTADHEEVLRNVARIKQWDHIHSFITLAHHFYNEICGHSLNNPISRTSTHSFAKGKFIESDINFFDSELIKIAESGGVFGIQLDQRRVASRKELKGARSFFSPKSKKLYLHSRLYWNQIRHIAEVLDFQETTLDPQKPACPTNL